MLPPLATSIAEIRAAVAAGRQAGKRIGFVPTMGALHIGHASLIRAARLECEFVVVSIFVNPTQFGPTEDFNKYPRTLEADRELCAAVGTDVIFVPATEEMYPPMARTFVEVTGLQDVLCGPSRPGHFRGVATIVLKLFNIVAPDVAFFGQKDAQQCLILQRMTSDLDLPVRIRIVPTIRESDGLAMSSRNRFLDPTQRLHASCLYRALEQAKGLIAQGERSVETVERAMTDLIAAAPGARLDYAKIYAAADLSTVDRIEKPILAALAVFFGTTRLIDNAIIEP